MEQAYHHTSEEPPRLQAQLARGIRYRHRVERMSDTLTLHQKTDDIESFRSIGQWLLDQPYPTSYGITIKPPVDYRSSLPPLIAAASFSLRTGSPIENIVPPLTHIRLRGILMLGPVAVSEHVPEDWRKPIGIAFAEKIQSRCNVTSHLYITTEEKGEEYDKINKLIMPYLPTTRALRRRPRIN
ncbi:hypothetical protein CR983_00270 [Candidatus Saccharibacteria bacterium]|nr:MAG: hypothetical protein CR983_00270 [Candidatus Saccharibacteria bacterium]